MKRLLLYTIVTLGTALTAFAEHEYIPFIGFDKEWVEFAIPYCARSVIGDTTIINGQEYYEMPLTYRESEGDYIKINYVREADKKVYLYRNEQEEMIYDFNAQAGDSIVALGDIGEYSILVDSVVERELDGVLRDFIYVRYTDKWNIGSGYYEEDIWIEGIGSSVLSIYMYNGRYSRTGYNSFGYYREPSTGYLYPADATLIDFGSVSTLGNDNAIVREGSRLTAQGNIVLYDTNGRLVATGTTIDLTSLPRGIYIACCSLTGGSSLTRKVVW